MIGHPGDNLNEVSRLYENIKKKNLGNIEQFQLFTPTPMIASSCMYWTGLNPSTLEKIPVIYDYNTKKKIKRIFLDLQSKNRDNQLKKVSSTNKIIKKKLYNIPKLYLKNKNEK